MPKGKCELILISGSEVSRRSISVPPKNNLESKN